MKYVCGVCGYEYDEAAGDPDSGIAAGTKWEDIPDDFICPVCGAPKSAFKPQSGDGDAVESVPNVDKNAHVENLRELSPGEISAICAVLSKACEKQRRTPEAGAWKQLADYFKAKTPSGDEKTFSALAGTLKDDLTNTYPTASAAVKAAADRGALRSLVWSEKVTTLMDSLVKRFTNEGDSMLENTRIYVCDICGYIYVGDTPPEICPVCKVPNFKITAVERR